MTHSNYANIISNSISPSKSDSPETIVFSETDTDLFSIDGSKIIANRSGNYNINAQLQVYSNTTAGPDGAATFTSWFIKNGVDVDASSATITLTTVSSTRVLNICGVLNLNEGDYFEIGTYQISYSGNIESFATPLPSVNGVGIPSVILTINKVMDSESETYQNYCNFYSFETVPKNVNTLENLVPTNIDTPDFSLHPDGLICNNDGLWKVLLAPQLVNYLSLPIASEGQIDIFFTINGETIQGSNASSTLTKKNAADVFCIAGSVQLKAGDILGFKVQSSSINDKLSCVLQKLYFTGVPLVPSFIGTLEKINVGVNMISTLNSPLSVNKNEKQIMTTIDSGALYIDNSKIICNQDGDWLFIIQQQSVSNIKAEYGFNSRYDSWFIVNGANVPNSAASVTNSSLAGLKILLVSAVFPLKKGDIVEIGSRSDSYDGNLNNSCKFYYSQNGEPTPSSIIFAQKL